MIALAVAFALIVARSFVFVGYEQSYFDSDQAIIGLMAKHLSEGRAFPLFFYGQSYMLGVESWFMAPFFWLGGPTVASLRIAMVTLNLAAASLMITFLWKSAGLRPFLGLAASLFFVIAPPYTSALLLEAQGGSTEPFIYVALLWWLRRRPMWFGAMLAFGFLNREFTLYAIPVILAGQLLTRQLWRRENARAWLLTTVAFFAVWEGINALKPYADLKGPGTRGQLLDGFAGSQLADVSARTSVSLSEAPARLAATVQQLVARLMNAQPIGGVAAQGHAWLAWLLVIAGAAIVIRIAWLLRRNGLQAAARAGFAWYLAGVGLVAIVAYAAAKIPADGTIRYLLLALLLPIGLVAALLSMETARTIRGAAAALVIGWAVVASVDNAAYIRRYASGGEPNLMRDLADALAARHVDVVEADYWRAYKLTFLTREHIVAASTDFVRIAEYQTKAAAAGDQLRRVQSQSCAGGEHVASFFLCR
jgi:hypothetical protein